MENNRKMVPKRRFKEFQNAGDWEQRKVKEFANESSLKGHTGIEAKKLTVKLHTRGVEKADVKIQGSDNTQYYIRRAGQLIYGKQNFFNGAIGIVPVMLDKYESTKDVPAFDIDKAVDVYWIYLYLARPETYEPQELNCTGTGSKRFHVSDFLNMPVTIPRLEEQQKISKYLKTYEYLITLHQRKLDKIKAIKKAYLSEMFPQNGEKKPRRRFKGFTDDWEQRKLGDVVQITMGQSPDGNTYSDEPSDYILVQGNSDLQNGWVCPRIWTTQITKKADAGDLIMGVRAPAGAMGKTAYNAVIGRGVAAIKGNEFIYQLLVKMDADGFWKTISCGSTFESLNSDNIKNAEVKIPTTAEQIKIGGYFQQLDNLITLHQRKLEKLKNIKKAYLNEMFV